MQGVSDFPEAIFAEAIAMSSADERRRFLDAACAGDGGLRRQIEKLVDYHFRAGDFLETPAVAELPPTAPLAEQPGDVVGRYRLLEQIGEGGMGAVFRAEQTEPVVRRVALKIIKPGMDTRQVIARFAAERQALALMDHPYIAKALDAGTTDSGRPYFVMDLVHGAPITEYCDAHRLTLRERLELFVPVCQAVQHAHQKGVIHRDLKPSNVLVAEYDGRPTPKIIDFGVAKAIGEGLAERTSCTRVDQLIGTVEYMSPEQAALNNADVDTRSDVYSLGVLLYELLAGGTPLDRQRLKSAAFDEMLRIVREEDPLRPSARTAANESLASIAERRRVEPTRLGALLRGDLDWIVMKALEKDRDRRYGSASELAADVQHQLAGEPVSAAGPSQLYRVGKFVRRNKGPAIAAAAVFLGLIALVVGTTIALVSQSRQRATAERERAEAQLNLAAALQSQLKYAEAEALYRQGLEIPSGDTSADRQRAARTLLRLGEVVPGNAETEKLFREAIAAYRAAFPPGDPNIAHALTTLALLLRMQGRYAEAEPVFREAYDINRQTVPADHFAVGLSAAYLGNVLVTLDRYAEAEPLLRESIAQYQLVVPPEEWTIALAQVELGRDLLAMGKFPQAEAQLLAAERVLGSAQDFRYGAFALAALYSKWDQGEPGKGYDAKAQQWFRKLIETFVRPETATIEANKSD